MTRPMQSLCLVLTATMLACGAFVRSGTTETDVDGGGEITTTRQASAALNPCSSSCPADEARLTANTITTRSVRGAPSRCNGDGPTASLSRKLTLGEVGGPRHALHDADRVHVSNCLSESCDG